MNYLLARRAFSNKHTFKKALYAGSFDPPSYGHLDVIERGLTLCDELTIGIATNNMKK